MGLLIQPAICRSGFSRDQALDDVGKRSLDGIVHRPEPGPESTFAVDPPASEVFREKVDSGPSFDVRHDLTTPKTADMFALGVHCSSQCQWMP